MFIIKGELIGKDVLEARISKTILLPKKLIKGALNKWRLSISNQIVSGLGGKTLKKRTGDLFRSATNPGNLTIVETSTDTFTIKFKNTLISYAYAHERGGELTPNPPNKFLAIPLRRNSNTQRPKPSRNCLKRRI